MSDAGAILTALTTIVETAVDGVTVAVDPTSFTKLTTDNLPYCILTHEPYASEQLVYAQERRTWVVLGQLAVNGGTREATQLLLEAIRDAVLADPTLGSSVDSAFCAPNDAFTNPDDPRVFGDFNVTAEKVA